jgi:hypothetical protein
MCGEDYRYVEWGEVSCFCNCCGFSFLTRDVGRKRTTDLAGNSFTEDSEN